jgi:hypothetical protein
MEEIGDANEGMRIADWVDDPNKFVQELLEQQTARVLSEGAETLGMHRDQTSGGLEGGLPPNPLGSLDEPDLMPTDAVNEAARELFHAVFSSDPTLQQKALVAALKYRSKLESTGPMLDRLKWKLWFAHYDRQRPDNQRALSRLRPPELSQHRRDGARRKKVSG